jgi:AcrR family transcriptional regulator
VYSHYRNKEDVIRFALLHSAYSLVEQLAIALLDTPAGSERIVEGIVLALEKLPNEPCLALITDTTLSQVVNEHTLTTEAGFKITTELFRFLIGENHLSEHQLREQAEFAIRTLFSLLNMHSPSERNSQQLRSFIAHWLLPALGLAIPEQYSH